MTSILKRSKQKDVPEPNTKSGKNRREGALYYFPERLALTLARIPDYSVTFVEAPSGYGKTTAVREYLKNNLPTSARVYWYTCLGEPPSKAWDGICGLLEHADVGVAEALKELYPPSMETIADIAALVRELRCESETFFVIDNYQLFENAIPRLLMDVFSVHPGSSLRVIFISQPLPRSAENVQNPNIHRLAVKDFLFDEDSISRYCRLSGIKIPEREIGRIGKISEGWISAIQLQIDSYRATGSLMEINDIDGLIETAVWNRLNREEKEFLLSVSLFDGFTPLQASIMYGAEIPKNLNSLLIHNAFIHFSKDSGKYYMHSLLRDYLRRRFELKDEVFRRETTRRAGHACVGTQDYLSAVRFFNFAEDYEAILSMEYRREYFYNQETFVVDMLAEVTRKCQRDMLKKYPFSLLEFAYYMFLDGRFDVYGFLRGCLDEALAEDKNRAEGDGAKIPEHDRKQIEGELALLDSFRFYNDIRRMSEGHRAALELFGGGTSVLYKSTTQWTFGNVSILFMFWRESGHLAEELDAMDECVPIYSTVVSGHGAGSPAVMRAEAALARGDDRAAEVLCREAIFLARSYNQESICLCAERVLAKAALLGGDEVAWDAALSELRQYGSSRYNRVLRRMAELSLASLSLFLDDAQSVADWLRAPESIKRTMFAQAVPYGETMYGALLLAEKRWGELKGMVGPAANRACAMHYVLQQVYYPIYHAVALSAEKKHEEARHRLQDALSLALPDEIYLPFAEAGGAILPTLKSLRKNFEPEKIDALLALCERYASGAAKIKKHSASVKSPLTPREKEIALLAKSRLSASEIASKLFISENTVNSTLKNIYNKLDIHSKTELTKIDL
jgi:LuxR family maltose regulon positive regulatory protein